MIIIHKIDDFLFNLFPAAKEAKEAKEAGKDLSLLKEEIANYYTFGPFKPKVEIQDDLITVEIDTSAITSQKSDFDTVVKYCETGKFHKAKPILEKLIKKNPTVSEYHRILGQIYSDEGRQEEAINCLIDALRWDPKNTHALTMMGNIFARSKNDITTAMSYYEQALVVKPDDHIAMNNIGANLMQLGRVDDAQRYFEQALSINSAYPNTLYGLGMVSGMKGNHLVAFDYAIQSLKKCKPGYPVYGNAFELAQQAGLRSVESIDPAEMFNQYSRQLAVESGKVIDVIQDDSIPTPAKIEIAENYGRDKHIIKFKKDRLAVAHLMMHELVHLDLITQCRKRNANFLFVSTKEQQALFIRDNEPTIQKLNREGLPDEAITGYITFLFNGINSQIYNSSVDLFIEAFLYKTYPNLRPFQFLSLLSLLKEYIEGATSKEALEHAPVRVRNANIILSLTHAFQFRDLFGFDLTHLFKATSTQVKLAKEFHTEYLKYLRNDKSLDAHLLILKWAKELRIENYFSLIDGNDYRSGPATSAESVVDIEFIKPSPLEGEGKGEGTSLDIQQDPAGQAAITMYCLSALQYFEDKELPEIQKVGFEIAMLGRQGIDPANHDKKYSLKSIPGKEFSGLQLLAYMYAAFQVIDPFLDTGLAFKKEYKEAKKLHEKR
ncbi:MAG: tetratricopeptide repeat protein [Nitrospirae bacterium]|nr:tetratricopeptide repeat protein [Nitrospirota bacterium]